MYRWEVGHCDTLQSKSRCSLLLVAVVAALPEDRSVNKKFSVHSAEVSVREANMLATKSPSFWLAARERIEMVMQPKGVGVTGNSVLSLHLLLLGSAEGEGLASVSPHYPCRSSLREPHQLISVTSPLPLPFPRTAWEL
uniref:Uncharacterized protein n=1 Tax=Parascaris univalens TaxID=6257 RepID=A0A915A935_PARUN